MEFISRGGVRGMVYIWKLGLGKCSKQYMAGQKLIIPEVSVLHLITNEFLEK